MKLDLRGAEFGREESKGKKSASSHNDRFLGGSGCLWNCAQMCSEKKSKLTVFLGLRVVHENSLP